MKQEDYTQQTLFLPDFCSVRAMVGTLLLGFLLALVLILSPLGKPHFRWEEGVLILLFIEGTTACNLILLCVLRPVLKKMNRFSAKVTAVFCWMLVMLVTIALLELAWHGVMRSLIPVSSRYNTELQHFLFFLRNLGIAAIVSAATLRYLYVSHQRRLISNAELNARMQSLQSRINPHFLFNTLNSIAGLTRINPPLAEQAVEDLAELFRAGLADAKNLVPLSAELKLCRRYLSIEKLRLEERLQVEWDLDLVPQKALIPSLALQTLLENALRHGIEHLPRGGLVKISGMSDGRYIRIDVENPLPPQGVQGKSGHRIAQDNLRRRLQAYYGKPGCLMTYKSAGSYRVGMRFPYLRNDGENKGVKSL